MRPTKVILPAALMLLALAPSSALARRHHRQHHSRVRHARIEHFGDLNSTRTTSNSADNAGTVQSFSNGRLRILLSDGSTVSGRVGKDTELECMAPEQNQTMHEDGDRGGEDSSGGGEDSGSGEVQGQSSGDQSSGEDQGDAAEQNENQAEEQTENEAGAANQDEMENTCPASSLADGTVVHEAELRVSTAGSMWRRVELES